MIPVILSSRRIDELFIAFSDDLGGVGQLTAHQHRLCRDAALMCAEAERLEFLMFEGGELDSMCQGDGSDLMNYILLAEALCGVTDELDAMKL